MKRSIIKIDEELCTGCGNCIPNCPEGAIQLIDCKARLISDLFCDGLGACIGECPMGAISTEIREAVPYNEREVMKKIIPQGSATIKAHLSHLLGHGEVNLYRQAVDALQENNIEIPEIPPLPQEIPSDSNIPISDGESSKSVPETETNCGNSCSGMEHFLEKITELTQLTRTDSVNSLPSINSTSSSNQGSLKNFPVQLQLVPIQAPYFQNATLIIAADCVPATMPNFYSTFIHDVTLLIACPKFDNAAHYIEKLTEIFRLNRIQSIQILIMEVPCCSGMVKIVNQALNQANKKDQIPLSVSVISTSGHILRTLPS